MYARGKGNRGSRNRRFSLWRFYARKSGTTALSLSRLCH